MDYEIKGWHVLTVFAAVLAIIGSFIYLCCLDQIEPGQVGVKLSWGVVDENIKGEGYYFVMPFRDQLIHLQTSNIRTDIAASAASKDLQEVNASIAVVWHMENDNILSIYRKYLATNTIRDTVVMPRASEVVKQFTAIYNAEEIITKRQELKDKIDSKLQEEFKSVGLVLDSLSIINVDFSADFNKAIEQKQIAEQQAKQAEYTAKKAEQDAQAAINYAKGQAESQRLQAQALDDKILYKLWIDKWNGVLPLYSSSSLPVPFKQVN